MSLVTLQDAIRNVGAATTDDYICVKHELADKVIDKFIKNKHRQKWLEWINENDNKVIKLSDIPELYHGYEWGYGKDVTKDCGEINPRRLQKWLDFGAFIDGKIAVLFTLNPKQ